MIQNVGKSDGDAQLRVERVESNGARTIIHSQQVKVNSGSVGEFNHRWIPDRAGSMWIEFIIIEDLLNKPIPSMLIVVNLTVSLVA